jgi:hypothetical protein
LNSGLSDTFEAKKIPRGIEIDVEKDFASGMHEYCKAREGSE